ncbi:MAG: rhodanese-like domain-containing protein [Phycisphaerales bacterium]|nr:rhodanese-like domain-containing protein [Phycisphaerales bacterium]
MTAIAEKTGTVTQVAPEMLAKWLANGDVALVDVREDFEYAAEWIPGAQHHALSEFEADAVRAQSAGCRVVFYCRSGKRATEAAQRFQAGSEAVFCLAGGIEGWKNAGREVKRSASAPRIDVMRQTQMVIGAFVLTGVLLGAFVSPWFLIISGFMGAGLIFAGASGTCGMAMMLARMPWNRVAASCSRPGN